MAESALSLDYTLGHTAGPVPADLAEGLVTDGSPMVLQPDAVLASLHQSPLPGSAPAFDWAMAQASLHGALTDAALLLQWLVLLYFIVSNGSYIVLNLMSLPRLLRDRREQNAALRAEDGMRGELPISLIVPICNRAEPVASALHAMLHLDYSEFEIIVVNDGADNGVLEALIREFSLAPFPEAYRDRLPTRTVKSVYASTVYPNLRLVDKEGGGRADALNAGINSARFPLFCGLDPACLLQHDSLRIMGRPFIADPATVATCSVLRAANGCVTRNGFASRVALPRNTVVLFQIVEQMRAILPGRAWWSKMNALLALPATLAVFRKEAVVTAGGFFPGLINEEMELVMRLHRLSRQKHAPYRIALVPDPVGRVFLPETIEALKNRHVRNQRSLAESLEMNRQLLFSRKGGWVGGVAFPFLALFELLGPLVELSSYVSMAVFWLSGVISLQAFGSFILLAVGLGTLRSVSGLMQEEIYLRSAPRLGGVLKLLAAALLENLGYQQLSSFWKVTGVLRWLCQHDAKRGISTSTCPS